MKNNKEEQQFKVFGYGFSAIFLWMAWRQWTRLGYTPPVFVFLAVSLAFIALTANKSRWLKVCFQLWMMAASFVGTAVTAIILTLVYALIFMPTALCLKFLGKDYMNRNWRDDRIRSYWLASPRNDQDQT
jgi:hypothetical protein